MSLCVTDEQDFVPKRICFGGNKSTLGVIITRNLSSTHFEHRTPFYRLGGGGVK